MIVAVIADTHLRTPGRLPVPCRQRLEQCELIVHAGDVVSASVFDELASIGPPLRAVRGNVDEPALAERLPQRLELQLGGAKVGIVHDSGPARGRLARMRGLFPECAAAIFGHSHVPLHESQRAFRSSTPAARRPGAALRATRWAC